MALDKLKREINERAAQAAHAAEEQRRSDAEKARAYWEYKNGQRPALQCLQLIERHFWVCVNDFSRLGNLKILRTNRPMFLHLFHIPGSAATLADPSLYVSFECGGWDRNTIKLEVSGQDALAFFAEYERMSHRSGDVSFPRESYVRVSGGFKIESFAIRAAHNWVETSFEDYYRKLMGSRNKSLK
jgi:hypothetical protein